MRIISLVPSITETLIWAGVNVVGRTRFCIHPEQASQIPVVGGTKEVDWGRVEVLRPELVIMDKEENTFEMFKTSPVPVHVLHVQDFTTLHLEIEKLANMLKNDQLFFLAQEIKVIIGRPDSNWEFNKVPGELEKINFSKIKNYEDLKIVYLIWKNPWMGIGKHTFIESLLKKLGAGKFLFPVADQYPKLDLKTFDLNKTFFLFSSEPFPFHKKVPELESLGLIGSVVDGESYSWYGLRALQFLKNL